jgi:carbohydrate diacid regulator
MYILNTGLAQEIVTRTMQIIPFNINVMDVNGIILASGNPARIGELHSGALLALAKKLTVEVDTATAKNLHGAKPGINLPLTVNGQVCGAVGLSGRPEEVRQFGELVRLTAEMILEQANLTNELQRDSRYREAFVLNLIRFDQAAQAELEAWGARLGFNFRRMQLVFLLELNLEEAGTDFSLAEIQRLQMRILARQPASLTATVGPREMVLVDSYDASAAKKGVDAFPPRRLLALTAMMQEECQQPFTLSMGIALPGVEGVAISYQSAKSAARVGRLRTPQQKHFSYYDLALPVLLSGLGAGWQAEQLGAPIAKLRAHDKTREMLRRTLDSWFAHNENSAATANALHIHRNTLDYRLRKIGELTGLDLARTEDRLLLYVSSLLTQA